MAMRGTKDLKNEVAIDTDKPVTATATQLLLTPTGGQ